MTYRDNDVFRWRYSEAFMSDFANRNAYHCTSQICIYKGLFVDTYWSSGGNKTFTIDDVKSGKIIIKFLGNLEDYVKERPQKRAFYSDKDCMNLNHPNSTSGNFYIKKDAKVNEDKVRMMYMRSIDSVMRRMRILERELKYYEDRLEEGNFSKPNHYFDSSISLYEEVTE